MATSRRNLWRSTAVLALVCAGCGSNATSGSAPSSRTATAPVAGGVAPTGPRLRGADYALTLAAGWRDATKKVRSAAVDRVIARRRPRAVAVIAMLKAPSGVSRRKLLSDRARSEIAGVHATAVTRRRQIRLDGEQAITYEYRSTSPAGAKVQARQLLVVHGGALHVIAVTAARAQFAQADTAFGTMLSTWRWTTKSPR
jgi:hypothetical protein